MKKLSQFQTFDKRFYADKIYEVQNVTDYFEYLDGQNTGKKLGCKINAVIIKDNTEYSNEDEAGINTYEKIAFKLPDVVSVNLHRGQRFAINVNHILKSSVYGSYRNQLSTTISVEAIILDKKDATAKS